MTHSLKTKTPSFQSIKSKSSLSRASIFSSPNQILSNPKSPIVLTRAQHQHFPSLSANSSSLLLKFSANSSSLLLTYFCLFWIQIIIQESERSLMQTHTTNIWKKEKPVRAYHMRYIYGFLYNTWWGIKAYV